MGVGDQQLPDGPSTAGPPDHCHEEVQHMGAPEGDRSVTRIRITGERAQCLWEAFCAAARSA